MSESSISFSSLKLNTSANKITNLLADVSTENVCKQWDIRETNNHEWDYLFSIIIVKFLFSQPVPKHQIGLL